MCDLASLPIGSAGRVKRLQAAGGIGRRLMDLGFTAGARVDCLLSAPCRGMRAYRVRRSVIALREKDARNIILEGKDHE